MPEFVGICTTRAAVHGEFVKLNARSPYRAVLRSVAGVVPFHPCANFFSSPFTCSSPSHE
jgi:hypothetical protein